MNDDKKAQQAVEKKDVKKGKHPGNAAGPHAKERLTDREKTPGTGSLSDTSGREADVGPD